MTATGVIADDFERMSLVARTEKSLLAGDTVIQLRAIPEGITGEEITIDPAGNSETVTVSSVDHRQITVTPALAYAHEPDVPIIRQLFAEYITSGAQMSLASDTSATDTTATVKSKLTGIADESGFAIIDPYTVQCEIKKVTGVSGNDLTVSALAFAHAENDPVLWSTEPMVNVLWFGATGDGTTEDTAAIQAAVDMGQAEGIYTVYFPAGNYLSDTIDLPDNNVKFLGEDNRSTTITQSNAANNLFEITSNAAQIHNLHWDNLYIQAAGSSTSNGIHIVKSSGGVPWQITITDCTLDGFRIGIYCPEGFFCRMRDVTFDNNTFAGFYGWANISNVYENVEVGTVPAHAYGVWILSTHGLVLSSGTAADDSGTPSHLWVVGASASLNYTLASIRSASYQWTVSGSGTDEYHLEASGGGDPSLSGTPRGVLENEGVMVGGTVGSLAVGEWDYDDNDALGYSTIYVRLSDGADPDGKAAGYVKYSNDNTNTPASVVFSGAHFEGARTCHVRVASGSYVNFLQCHFTTQVASTPRAIWYEYLNDNAVVDRCSFAEDGSGTWTAHIEVEQRALATSAIVVHPTAPNAGLTVSGIDYTDALIYVSPTMRVKATKANQAIATGTPTTVTWDAKPYDGCNTFATNAWTPTIPGVYNIGGMVTYLTTEDQKQYFVRILVDGGAVYEYSGLASGAADLSLPFNCDLYLDGTEAVTIQVEHDSTGSHTVSGTDTQSMFFGRLLG